MKKKVAIAIGLAVLSTSALASKARLEALGQNAEGSMWLDDARNVMLNPAHLNYHKDFMTMEWGNTDAGSADVDATSTPRAEGGMFKASGNMVYGLYFGSESNTSNSLRRAAMGGNEVEEQNNTDFFIAGDAGVQWGARLTYHSYTDEVTDTATDDKISSSATRLTLGVVSGDTHAFLNYGLGNTAEDEQSGTEFKGNSSMDLGVTHNMNDMAYMLRYSAVAAENASGNEVKVNKTWLGAGKQYKLNDKANAWAEAWYKMENSECDAGITAACSIFTGEEEKSTYLPVTMGVEVMAKDWLTLRGSVAHEIMGTDENADGDKKTRTNTTVVNAGASLTFGDLSVDGTIGNNSDTGVAGNNTASGTGVLRTDALMSRVSMTYKF